MTLGGAKVNKYTYISTHTPHTECDQYILGLLKADKISTHTPHTECDAGQQNYNEDLNISTHTPHTECDCKTIQKSLFILYNFYYNSFND